MRDARFRAACLLLLASAAGACRDASADAAFAGTVDTLAGGVIHTRSPARGLWKPGQEWKLVEELRIGSAEEEGPTLFGEVSGLQVDAAGRIYVLEPQAREIRVFDAAGRHLRSIGRKGKGPGEFENPAAMMWDPAGRLWVVDQQNARFSVFDTAGAFVTSHLRPGGFSMFPWPGGMDRQGRLYDVALISGDDFRHGLVRFNAAMQPADTFRLPEHKTDAFELRDDAGRRRISYSVPHTPSQVWRLDDGHVWTGISDRYRLARLNFRGDTLRIVEREYEPAPVTAEDRDTAIARLKSFTDQGGKIDAGRIPSRKPAFGSLLEDDRRHLWVTAMVATEDQGKQLDVFDPEGRYLGRVAAPERLFLGGPVLVRGDRVYAVVQDEMDVPYVVRYRIEGREP